MTVHGMRTFGGGGDAYDAFMGRYSVLLAPQMADLAGIAPGQRVIDVGCGTGALVRELVEQLGADAVVELGDGDLEDDMIFPAVINVRSCETPRGRRLPAPSIIREPPSFPSFLPFPILLANPPHSFPHT